VLVTTPPVNEYQLNDDYRSDGTVDKTRSARNAMAYAEACRVVGEELIAADDTLELVVCDLWSKMMVHCGWRGQVPIIGSLQTDEVEEMSNIFRDGK